MSSSFPSTALCNLIKFPPGLGLLYTHVRFVSFFPPSTFYVIPLWLSHALIWQGAAPGAGNAGASGRLYNERAAVTL